MNDHTNYHAPIVLADERERRARKQRPYPAVFDHLPDVEKDFEQRNTGGARIACVGLVCFLFLIALVIWAVRASLKG